MGKFIRRLDLLVPQELWQLVVSESEERHVSKSDVVRERLVKSYRQDAPRPVNPEPIAQGA